MPSSTSTSFSSVSFPSDLPLIPSQPIWFPFKGAYRDDNGKPVVLDCVREAERRIAGNLFMGMRRPDEVDGEPSKKRKRKSSKEFGTSREFGEIKPEAKPTDGLGSDDGAPVDEDDTSLPICNKILAIVK
ncbi:hypothetical protein LWI28_023757 [Acer negundo]|uniref:Uncharacterized protein n=1 Tax=Acer negundo TaxID=4023 RepID=A0AAD5JE05_ACENE|nr:hypothetical protein LWI28_023757 [Acer negundo]